MAKFSRDELIHATHDGGVHVKEIQEHHPRVPTKGSSTEATEPVTDITCAGLETTQSFRRTQAPQPAAVFTRPGSEGTQTVAVFTCRATCDQSLDADSCRLRADRLRQHQPSQRFSNRPQEVPSAKAISSRTRHLTLITSLPRYYGYMLFVK